MRVGAGECSLVAGMTRLHSHVQPWCRRILLQTRLRLPPWWTQWHFFFAEVASDFGRFGFGALAAGLAKSPKAAQAAMLAANRLPIFALSSWVPDGSPGGATDYERQPLL
jgi:hypothetical protein